MVMEVVICRQPSTTYLTDVELLCVECQRPIKARINTEQWIRVEFIGPNGECRECCNGKKADDTDSRTRMERR